MAALFAAACFLFCGQMLSHTVFEREGRAVKLWLGGVFGITLWMWLPALFSFFLDFTVLSQWLAAAAAVLLSAFLLLKKRSAFSRALLQKPGKPGLYALLWTLPLWLFSLWLLLTHTIPAAADGSLRAGQSTYGDMAMHLGFLTSFSVQKTFPPNYSILPGTPMGYPFLCDSISSTLYTLGLSLRWAYLLPMAAALLCVFSGGYLLLRQWLKDTRKAALGQILFFLGGGFGFAYFLDGLRDDPQNFKRIFTAFYETPTNYVKENVRWVNPIADLLIPQRATLFGWTLLFACLFLLYRAAFEKKNEYFLPLGILAGCLPLVHTHSFLALGLISAVLFLRALIREKSAALKPWLLYAGAALLLAAPQLLCFTFRQSGSEGFLRLGFNWSNAGDNYFWFYIKNIGLPYLLLLPAFLSADRDSRWLYGGGLLILLLSECIIFQPNPYDNNKLLFVWHLLGCGLVAGFLVNCFDRLKGIRGRAVLAALTVCVCILGGVLTLGREAVSDYELFSSDEVALSEYVKEQTPADAIFLTANNHDNAIAALTGRNILCGSGSYLYFHGLNYSENQAALTELYETPSLEGLRRWNVDYILISSHERYAYDVDEAWFSAHCTPVYSSGNIILYQAP